MRNHPEKLYSRMVKGVNSGVRSGFKYQPNMKL